MERRLAAILIADVVGYTRLSQFDEEGTRESFQSAIKENFEPAIRMHHGRLVKTMGDGVLVEFGSVVNALRCAVDIQRTMADRNDEAANDKRMEFRIAINLGDVIVEGEDIHGTGVNIADRLQTLAGVGRVVISGSAYDQMPKLTDIGYEFLGEHSVKNILEPVRVYDVLTDVPATGRADPKPAGSKSRSRHGLLAVGIGSLAAIVIGLGALWYLPRRTAAPTPVQTSSLDRPSIVVLPLDNLSDDKEQGYLADGITEDLTTELARVPGLFVISRNAAFAYKDKATEPAEIAKALGVRYLLEGSIRRVGNDLRISAQLIDGTTAGHLWAERFDGPWGDVFRLQDRVVGSIAETLKLRLVSGQGRAGTPGGTGNPAAYDAYLRGSELESRNTPEDVAKAVTYYQQALQLDPNFGTAMAALAWLYWNADEPRLKALGITWEEQEAKLNEFLSAAAKHPSPAYYQIAAELLVRQSQSDEAIAMLQKAIALDPSHPWTYEGLSQALIFNGRPMEGRSYLDAAMQVDPGWTDWRYYQAGLAAFGQNKFEDAAAWLDKIDVNSPDPWAKFYGLQVLLSAYGHLGRDDEIAAVKEKLGRVLKERGEGELTQVFARAFFVYKNELDGDRLFGGLAKAGVSEFPSDVDVNPNDRLTGSEIRSLIFGHEMRGRRVSPNPTQFTLVVSAKGSATLTVGQGTSEGTAWVQGDFLCDVFGAGSPVGCAGIFRNSNGTTEHLNEYQTIGRMNRNEFSIVR